MGIGRKGLLKNEDGLMHLSEITERMLLYQKVAPKGARHMQFVSLQKMLWFLRMRNLRKTQNQYSDGNQIFYLFFYVYTLELDAVNPI